MYSKFDIPERLRQLRKDAALTQEEFAEHSGISYKFYQHVESGRKKLIRIDTIERICVAYNLSLSEFFQTKLPKISIRVSKALTSSPHNKKRTTYS